jgi:hypothetical protein
MNIRCVDEHRVVDELRVSWMNLGFMDEIRVLWMKYRI